MYRLRFRQVHLDFHTSEKIVGIGEKFDKKVWQETLQEACVDSITCFSKGHHGWSYHDTKVGQRHPHMKGELFRQQYEACKEIDVNIPIYLSAGVDNVITKTHPEWRELNPKGELAGWSRSPLSPGFHKLCFNSPYLDYLCEQIVEAIRMFPESNGVFLDIISQGDCCCNFCMKRMDELGLDATNPEHRQVVRKEGLERYYKMTTDASKIDNSDMPVFHNSGHIQSGNRDILKYFSHLELESLPTGGWGYDHFPMSAKYCKAMGTHDLLGMTGKFHTTWGEFGGFKHPNALRYECAAMLAYGSKCSVGDQLRPSGEIDKSTYGIIGAAYKEVKAKEAWCDNVDNITDLAILSADACADESKHDRNNGADTGANRIMLEGHFLYDIIDMDVDFGNYKILVLPDDIEISEELKKKLDAYLAKGGKLFLTGKSGLDAEGKPIFDFGGTVEGESEFSPDYILPCEALRPEFCSSPFVMYGGSQRLTVTDGESMGDIYDPCFNRTYAHFCSHQHAPNQEDKSGYSCGVSKGNIFYLPHRVFNLYAAYGAVAHKDFVVNAIRMALGSDCSLEVNLPSTGRTTVTEQKGENRYIVHLLYATTIKRGGAPIELSGGNAVASARGFEVIEDLSPLNNIEVSVKLDKQPKTVKLVPEDREIDFTVDEDTLTFTIDQFTCHQMIEIAY